MEEVFLYIFVIIFSVVVHEYAHAWSADQFGDSTARDLGRLTLNPIVHLDIFGSFLIPLLLYIATQGTFIFGWAKPVPYNPDNLKNRKRDSALIAIAGPVANLIIATLFGISMRVLLVLNFSSSGLLFSAFYLIIIVNIFLAVFNLIPIPPLDGSKILFAFLPAKAHKVKSFLERYGFYILLIFLLFGFVEIMLLPIIENIYKIIAPM